MGGVWVFPGASVGLGEERGLSVRSASSRREAGITPQETEAIVRFSQWIKPAQGQDPA